MWVYANPNPCRKEEPDCVVRAVSLATGKTWDEVHMELCELSGIMCSMPSVNRVWKRYLEESGFQAFQVDKHCPKCVTVRAFAHFYPHGIYVVATGSHAVCVADGNWMDTWDSGDQEITYFFKRKGT